MSGGHFDYIQFRLDDPINEIEARVLLNKKTRSEAHEIISKAEDEDLKLYELLYSVRDQLDFWNLNPLRGFWPEVWDPKEKSFRKATKQEVDSHNSELVFDYDDEEVEAFKQASLTLREARAYLQRIDWLFSGEDSGDGFKKRLAEDLAEARGSLKLKPADTPVLGVSSCPLS